MPGLRATPGSRGFSPILPGSEPSGGRVNRGGPGDVLLDGNNRERHGILHKPSMPEDQSLRVALPDSLRRQFANLEKRLLSLESWMALSAALIVLLGAFLLFFVSDRFWETPVWLRLVFSLGALAGICLPALWWLNRWVFRRRDLRALAIILQ